MFGIAPKHILVIVVVLLAVLATRDWMERDIHHAPGVLVPEQPVQISLGKTDSILLNGYYLNPRADFQIRARVLSRENYRWDTESDISPMDLALGWGAMSDQAVLDRISIEQRSRWYFTRYEAPAPLSDRQIIRSSSNMHMVPADSAVREELERIRVGDVVQLYGSLVDVDSDSGWKWRTSLSREDTGNGACEIVYVQNVVIEPRT